MNLPRFPFVAALAASLLALAFFNRKKMINLPQSVYDSLFIRAENVNNLPPGLLKRIAYRESRFRSDVVSGKTKGMDGEIGIMQILPKAHPGITPADMAAPSAAIPYAGKLVRSLLNQFGSVPMAVAAYNWGSGNLQKFVHGSIKEIPAGVKEYVREVTGVSL